MGGGFAFFFRGLSGGRHRACVCVGSRRPQLNSAPGRVTTAHDGWVAVRCKMRSDQSSLTNPKAGRMVTRCSSFRPTTAKALMASGREILAVSSAARVIDSGRVYSSDPSGRAAAQCRRRGYAGGTRRAWEAHWGISLRLLATSPGALTRHG